MGKMRCGDCKYGVEESQGVVYCTNLDTNFRRAHPDSFCNYYQEKEEIKDDKVYDRSNG